MLYWAGFRGSRHYAPKVLDEEEDDFFIIIFIIRWPLLLLGYYVDIFVLFITYYKKFTLVSW
jgi:hypothetical protein